MLQVLFLVAFTAAVTFQFVGLVASLFIAVVLTKSWMKSHIISPSDRILFSVGITRVLLLGLFLLDTFFFFIFPEIARSAHVFTFLMLWWMFLDNTSLWFVTLLNALYCVKITNFQNSVFRLLKRNLSPKTPGLLLACVLLSALTTLLYFVLRLTSPFAQCASGVNCTMTDMNDDVLSLVTSFVLSSFLQFVINVTSASLLINSLRKHIQKMQNSATGFWNPQTEAHVGAMKLMIYFLVLYVPYSLTSMLLHLSSSVSIDLEGLLFCVVFVTLYPSGHSLLIILTHPKLKTKAREILCFYKY